VPQAIITRAVEPTNTRGTRIIATLADGLPPRVTLGWDHSLSRDQNHRAAALEFCRRFGWYRDRGATHLIEGGLRTGHAYIPVYMPDAVAAANHHAIPLPANPEQARADEVADELAQVLGNF